MADSNPEQRYPDDYWDGRADSLATTRVLLHNDDYLEFLVTRVWRIDRPSRIVDFGCGSGRFGQILMPFMPEGSTYTGFDTSEQLLAEARRVYECAPFEAQFVRGDVHEAPFADDSFDIAPRARTKNAPS